ELPGAAGGLVQELGVRVVAGRGIDQLAHVLGVVGAGGIGRWRGDVGGVPVPALQPVEDVRGIGAQVDAQVVHEVDLPVLVDPREDRLLRVGGALADLGTAGVV